LILAAPGALRAAVIGHGAPAFDRLHVAAAPSEPRRTRITRVRSGKLSSYEKLTGRTRIDAAPQRSIEGELDSLIQSLSDRSRAPGGAGGREADPIRRLRDLTLTVLVPVFVELVEKYSKTGISMQMDASNFLEGGREVKFQFGLGEMQINMLGTVTTEGIAFHETRQSPDSHGELTSGPMLRLRHLNDKTFREFICERLSLLVRHAMRRR